MMTALVQARYAGGPIWVGIEELPNGRRVSFRAPVESFPLHSTEARLLAIRLLEAAAEAEKPDDPDEHVSWP